MTIFAARLSRRWFSKHLEEGRESERESESFKRSQSFPRIRMLDE